MDSAPDAQAAHNLSLDDIALDAYGDGQMSAAAGETFFANPHQPGGDLWQAWNDGFNDCTG